ncbi:MAG: cation:dicarboxylase symporter family transporter [Pseudomonadota bacterium]|nr:cation:dicarboxylase symporter family transporter [Pseudomonadota bacterium]
MAVTSIYNKLSPFQRVILALIFGILAGIFVGEPAGKLEIIGNAYIRLLQMTVLPYVLVSIIGGLGRLDNEMAASIGIRAVKVILIMWLAVMLTLVLLPLAYPDWVSSGFFSSSLVTEAVKFNFLDLYIPANVFSSLANTIVPAVVLFSLLMGIALINVKDKDILLGVTSNVGDSLMRVASFVAKLAPVGIFAIAASAAGTLQPEELERLQVFLWVYLTAAFLLGFVLLPLIVHWATPFSYRELMSVAGEAMVTALATGTVLVVLPMIAERCKEMLKNHNMDCDDTSSTVDVLVPTAYSFPSTGTLLGLGFILFAAWYVGSPLGVEQYPSFIIMGAFTAFGSMAVAIPFLLDYFNLPADLFQLYLLGSVVTARVATALAALHGFVVTLLVAAAVLKRLSWHRLIQAIGLHLGVTAGVMILLGIALTHVIPYEYTGIRTFEGMRLMGQSVEAKNVTKLTPLSTEDQARPRLDIIKERGSLRIGYFSNTLPFAFRNDQNEVVGLDMDLVHILGRDIGLSIELTRLKDHKNTPRQLDDGSLDVAIGGLAITPNRALHVAFSNSYIYHTVGLMMLDARRKEFSSVTDINEMEQLNLGVPKSSYYKNSIQKIFPNAKLTEVSSPRDYFKGKYKKLDAFIYPAETGSAWAMLYPEYAVVVPKGLKLKAPAGLTLPKGQLDYVQFINTWLQLKEENGQLQLIYDYWILGENPKAEKPRWSVMKDVLGWTF